VKNNNRRIFKKHNQREHEEGKANAGEEKGEEKQLSASESLSDEEAKAFFLRTQGTNYSERRRHRARAAVVRAEMAKKRFDVALENE